MKKFLTVLLILSAVNIYAASSPNGVSVYFSTGYNPTGMGLTDFMEKPFYPNFTSPPAYQSVFGPGVFYPSMSMLDVPSVLKDSKSENTYSTGTALSLGLKFNFLTFLFLRSEITFDSNAYSPIKYEAAFNNPMNMSNTIPFDGAVVKYEFSYESMSVPVVFGFNIPIEMKGKYKADIYIAAGLSWTSARYFFSIDAPSRYVHDGGVGYSAFNEELDFKANTVGYLWIIGADYEVAKDLNLFFEVDSFIYNTVLSEAKYKSSTMTGITSGGPKTQMDLTHTIAKIGVSYKFSSLVKDFFF